MRERKREREKYRFSVVVFRCQSKIINNKIKNVNKQDLRKNDKTYTQCTLQIVFIFRFLVLKLKA